MGKSGHVARKLAATLASTGTPALFVHPGEASHGDLGMITPQDYVLALSNSGNTAELAAIIGYCKRFAIPLLGIVGRAASQLAEEADVALILPETPEACPLGLAPTTSTTMMLALGDALAVALLERRGFTAQDFQVLHPGGALGARLLRVKDLMHGIDRLPLARPETPMSEAILAMSAQPFGCVGIVDAAGRLVGIVTDGDLRRHMGADLLRQTAGAVMTRGPRTIRPQALAAEAIGYMNDRRILSLFVVEDERPLGIVQLYDCLRAGVA
jgi:arabinose-5-phosphate isomerase